MDKKALSFALIVTGALMAVLIATGQGPSLVPRQEWRLKSSDSPGMVQLTIERWKPNSHWSSSNNVRFANFRGLTREAMERGGPAQFEYVQDAGTLVCQGKFGFFRGAGTFRFEPNPKFVSDLKSLGYDAPEQEQLFSMMLSEVTLDFARGVRDADVRASTRELIELRNHGVSLDYIREAAHAGYKNLFAQDFIELRDHGVSTRFLRDLKNYNYNLAPHDIVELRDHGVSSEFVGDLKSAGYDLPSHQIVELANHGVNSDYLREIRDFGLQPHASELTQLRDHGISPKYLKGLRDAGYDQLTANEITELGNHGVSTDFIQEARDLGYSFTPREIIELRDHGVDSAYLRRLRDTGMKNLGAGQIVKLREHGVE
jgi:hypothetical protein